VVLVHHPRLVQPHQHHVQSDFHDVFPGDHQFRGAAEHPEKPRGGRHDDGLESPLPHVELQVADLAELFAVDDIDDILRLEIGYFHRRFTRLFRWAPPTAFRARRSWPPAFPAPSAPSLPSRHSSIAPSSPDCGRHIPYIIVYMFARPKMSPCAARAVGS